MIEKAISCSLQAILLYGPRMKKALQEFSNIPNKVLHFEKKEEIKDYLKQFPRKTVLIKASRGMKLEEIIEREEK